MPFFNTAQAGPMVIEIPPADGGSITGSIMDCWQTPLEDVGPAGVDKGKGGKYLILQPGHSGAVPDGYIALRSQTYQGYALLRSILRSGSDTDFAKGGRIWETDRVLSSLYRGEPTGDDLSRRRRRRLQRHDPVRCALLRIAGA
jgi:hypothetical protein